MKFFHLSDLHIGIKLYNRDLLEDQKIVLRQIVEQAGKECPDAIVIAGDIYDKAIPSVEAVGVFDQFVRSLRRTVPDAVIMMISGNHDSAPRVNLYRNILEEQKIYMVGMPPQRPEEQIEKVTLQDAWGNVNFYLLPFVKPSMVKTVVGTGENGNLLSYQESLRRMMEREQIREEERNVCVSHQFYLPVGTGAEQVQRMDSEICTVGNIDQVSAEILKKFDYSALGHIHKPMKVGGDRIWYCGTPMQYSVSEAGQKKAILMVELKENGTYSVTPIPLNAPHEVRIIKGKLNEILKLECEDYVSVLLTDRMDLDICDMQDRLYTAFPNLLEIRRERWDRPDYEMADSQVEMDMDPYLLCCSFLKDLNEEEKALLKKVIGEVQEEQE